MKYAHVIDAKPRSGSHRDEVTWRCSPRDEAKIVAFAALCEYFGKQREPLGNEELDLATSNAGETAVPRSADEEPDVAARNVKTQVWLHKNEQVGPPANEDVVPFLTEAFELGDCDLKSCLLNRLAEVLTRVKHASFISCTALQEHENHAVITIVRNSKNAAWDKKDRDFLEILGSCLLKIASGGDLRVEHQRLWGAMLEYYSQRMEFYLKDLSSYIKREQVLETLRKVKAHTAPVAKFFALCLDIRMVNNKANPRLVEKIVQCAYELRLDRTLCIELLRYFKSETSIALITKVAFVGRLRLAYFTFVTAACQVDSLQKISFRLVTPATFQRLERSTDTWLKSELKATGMFGMIEDKDRFWFPSLFNENLWVHAEMQMLFYLFQDDDPTSHFPYLGISKRTCFLCGHFLRSLGLFTTRSNHGQMESKWRLPSTWNVPSSLAKHLEASLKDLHDILDVEAKKSRAGRQCLPQSSAALSAHISRGKEEALRRLQSETESNLQFTRFVEGGWHQDTGIAVDDGDQTQTEPRSCETHKSPPSMSLRCAGCGSTRSDPPMAPCAKCKTVSYCTESCQNRNWVKHKFKCRYMTDAADILVLDCIEGTRPFHPDVCEAFKFSNFKESENRYILFGIYITLVTCCDIGDVQLREAWKNNTLHDMMVKKIKRLPEQFHHLLHWLEKQKDALTGSKPGVEAPPFTMDTWFKALLHNLKPQVDDVEVASRKPIQFSFILYSRITLGRCPSQFEEVWKWSGFYTARTSEEKELIARIYRCLIKSCTFTEFWQAMENSTLGPLLDKYKLGGELQYLPGFKAHIYEGGSEVESVWHMSECVPGSDHIPMRVFCLY